MGEGGKARPTGLSLGLSGLDDPALFPGHLGEIHPLSWESAEGGFHVMVSGRNLYRVVTGVEKLGID